jgi:hypothetical protein
MTSETEQRGRVSPEKQVLSSEAPGSTPDQLARIAAEQFLMVLHETQRKGGCPPPSPEALAAAAEFARISRALRTPDDPSAKYSA